MDMRRERNDGSGLAVSAVELALAAVAVAAAAATPAVASDDDAVVEGPFAPSNSSLRLTFPATSLNLPDLAKASTYKPQASSLPINTLLLVTSPADCRAITSYHPAKPLNSDPSAKALRRVNCASSDSGWSAAMVSNSAMRV